MFGDKISALMTEERTHQLCCARRLPLPDLMNCKCISVLQDKRYLTPSLERGTTSDGGIFLSLGYLWSPLIAAEHDNQKHVPTLALSKTAGSFSFLDEL